jgi:murein hydrolase activator
VLGFERAFTSQGGTAHTAIYGAGPADPADVASGFASMKGRLPFPLAGRTEIHSARRSGADGPGLEMRAPRGTPVRSVFPGRVAFADDYAAYGRTVILEHGGGFYSVSANLDEIAVSAGEDVLAGARLGTVGDTGAGSLLHFEIRSGADTLDPAEWFGI